MSATLEFSDPLDRDRGTTGFSWSRAVRMRQEQVFGSGLRTWLASLAVIVLTRALLSLTRDDYPAIVPLRVETVFAVGTIAAALALSLAPPRREGSVARAAIEGGTLTLAAAAFVTMAALHGGFGHEVMHAIVIIMLVGMPMVLPLPILIGVPILAAVAAVYPVMQLVAGTARWSDPIFAAQVVDLCAGFGMATLVLVLHNVLFASRWRALRDLAQLAEHDGLTGVYNRRAFVNRLLAEADRSRRYGAPLGLVMYDLDAFKRFNTEEGYAAGDAMLRAVSATLARMTRLPQYARFGAAVARYGGEEFVIILPGADPAAVGRFADESREAIAELRVPFGDRPPMRVTVSTGYVHTDGRLPVAPGTLIEAADKALYAAKAAGGNRTAQASPVDETTSSSSPRLAVRRGARTAMPTSAVAALKSDSRQLHGMVLRWMFAVTAVWAGMLSLMDVAFRIAGVHDLELWPVLAGRLTMVAILAGLAAWAPHLNWWQERLTALHAAFVVGILAAIVFTMERSGGLTSPYFGQLVYVIAAWALAFSVRPLVSIAVLFGVTVAIPLYYVGFVGVDPLDYGMIMRTAVLAGAGAVALGTQSVFRGLRAEEVAARHSLDRLARVDPLTGLPNRVAFEDRLERLLVRCGPGSPLSVAVLDLDHFKKLNDTHGHVAGDEALIRVGHAIEGSVRAADLAARLGGEEFAVALPMTDGPSAVASAERLRQAIADLPVVGGAATVAASVGVACWREGDTLSSLMARADGALRQAKALGRDRVVLA